METVEARMPLCEVWLHGQDEQPVQVSKEQNSLLRCSFSSKSLIDTQSIPGENARVDLEELR